MRRSCQLGLGARGRLRRVLKVPTTALPAAQRPWQEFHLEILLAFFWLEMFEFVSGIGV